jgi:hypothetical protein
MNGSRAARILVALGMVAATVFGGAATAAAETDSTVPTAPTNVRAVLDSERQVTAIEWDASTGGTGPITYHVYLDGSEIEMSSGLRAELPPGCLFECDAGLLMSVPVVVTAKSGGVESPPSEAITLSYK